MIADRSAAGFTMNVDGVTAKTLDTQDGLDDVVGRVFAGVRAAAIRLGEVKPFAIVMTSKAAVVVDYPVTLLADEAMPLWAERIRALAKDLDASATLVVTSTKLGWRREDPKAPVVLLTVDHRTLDRQQWVAAIEKKQDGDERVGEHCTLIAAARAACPGKEIAEAARPTGIAKPLMMLMPRRLAN